MPNMRGWSLFCKESYWLAQEAYSRGYGLACYVPTGIALGYGVTTTSVLVTPGVFSHENNPNNFTNERMTRKQIREYRDLSEKVYAFNTSW